MLDFANRYEFLKIKVGRKFLMLHLRKIETFRVSIYCQLIPIKNIYFGLMKFLMNFFILLPITLIYLNLFVRMLESG